MYYLIKETETEPPKRTGKSHKHLEIVRIWLTEAVCFDPDTATFWIEDDAGNMV